MISQSCRNAWTRCRDFGRVTCLGSLAALNPPLHFPHRRQILVYLPPVGRTDVRHNAPNVTADTIQDAAGVSGRYRALFLRSEKDLECAARTDLGRIRRR